MFIDRKTKQLLNTLRSWDYEVIVNSNNIELYYNNDDKFARETFSIVIDYYHITLNNELSQPIDFTIDELNIFTELIEYIRANCK